MSRGCWDDHDGTVVRCREWSWGGRENAPCVHLPDAPATRRKLSVLVQSPSSHVPFMYPNPPPPSVVDMSQRTILRAVADAPDETHRNPITRRPRHALISGERHALCGARIRAITPGAFDPHEELVCGVCRARAVAHASDRTHRA